MKYRCLIAEDDIQELDALEMHLRNIPQLEVVAACNNGLEALQVLAWEEIDIVFSNIDMPGLNGTTLLKKLKHPPVFVFITANSKDAAKSYDLDAVDFIVKPVTFERLETAANKATEFRAQKKAAMVAAPSIR
jgi:two-component system LytT family response regulator